MVTTFIVCTVKEIQLTYACLKSFTVPFRIKSSWESCKEHNSFEAREPDYFLLFFRSVKASHILISVDGKVYLSGLRSNLSMINHGQRLKVVHDFPKYSIKVLPWLSPEVLQQVCLKKPASFSEIWYCCIIFWVLMACSGGVGGTHDKSHRVTSSHDEL